MIPAALFALKGTSEIFCGRFGSHQKLSKITLISLKAIKSKALFEIYGNIVRLSLDLKKKIYIFCRF